MIGNLDNQSFKGYFLYPLDSMLLNFNLNT